MTNFPIFRAEAVTPELRAGSAQCPRASVRMPSNVPYIVDNLWEVLRLDGMPSRRQAIYASPSRALALQNQSGRDRGDGFCVYRVVVDGSALIAQIPKRDAREHADIKNVQVIVQSEAASITSAPDDEKPFLALLFLPGATKADWKRARSGSPIADRLAEAMRAASTFWQDASSQPDPESDGELFFQLAPGSTYRAADLEPCAGR
jgi:hypothetical protein